jgi:hypothetical protein
MTVTVPASPVLILAGVIAAAAVVLLYWCIQLGKLMVTRLEHDPVMVVIMEAIGGIGVVGWIQSFVSLRALAFTASLPEWEADTSPALLDTFALAMGLAALRARHLRGKGDLHADVLAIGYSVVAVIGNVATALVVLHDAHETDLLTIFVTLAYRLWPPLTMLFGFHWLMGNMSPKPPPAAVVVTRVEQIQQAVMVAVEAGLVELHDDVAAALPALMAPTPRRVDGLGPRQADELRPCHDDEESDARTLVTLTSSATSDDPDEARQDDEVGDETADDRGVVRPTKMARQADEPKVVALRQTTRTTTTVIPPLTNDPDVRKMGRALLANPRLSNVALGKKVGVSEPTARRKRPLAEGEALRLRALREAEPAQEAEA